MIEALLMGTIKPYLPSGVFDLNTPNWSGFVDIKKKRYEVHLRHIVNAVPALTEFANKIPNEARYMRLIGTTLSFLDSNKVVLTEQKIM